MANHKRTVGAGASDAIVAGMRLHRVYSDLLTSGKHLFGDILSGAAPVQWAHYPEDDAVDVESGYQWFYHSHSKQDRMDAGEHGHIHLFARRKLWSQRLKSARELKFATLSGGPPGAVSTRHLLSIGFNAVGLPIKFFTVNSWVTGDLMLSAETTAHLLASMSLDTGHRQVDAVIMSVTKLYEVEILNLLKKRDNSLFHFDGPDVLSDESLEILSELPIVVDEKLS